MDHLALLEELVSQQSVFPNEAKLGEFLFDYLIKLGFVVEKQFIDAHRFNLLAKKGIGKKALMFYGHLDTVPFDSNLWQTDPLKLTKKGNKLFGLGVYDMKAGIAAILQVCADTDRYIKILLAVDEENISEGAWEAVKRRADFFQDVELVISAEPNFGLGLNGVTNGRTGRAVFQLKFIGKPTHIIHYLRAIDAVELAGEFINKFYAKREKLFSSPQTVALINKIEGSSQGMSVCGEVLVEIEVFLGVEDNIQSVQKKIQSLTKAHVLLKPRKTPYLEGYYFKTFPYQEEIGQIIKNITGKKMVLHQRSSVGDDNVLASLGLPVITWGPDGGNAHTANEYLELKGLEKLIKMYQEILKLTPAL